VRSTASARGADWRARECREDARGFRRGYYTKKKELTAMPMPPILGTIDWRSVHESGKTYAEWLAGAENPDRRGRIEEGLKAQGLPAPVENLLKGLARPVHVVAIAEDWCGDVVRHVPVLERLALAAPKIQTRYISRAQHKDVFVRFLTNGGEAIPKFIFLNDKFVECGNWGPMTEACKRIIARGKACGDGAAARQKVGQMYEMDGNRLEVVQELVVLALQAAAEAP
jgi:hypothetical protein